MTRMLDDYNRHELERARKALAREDFMAALLLVSICGGVVIGYLVCRWSG